MGARAHHQHPAPLGVLRAQRPQWLACRLEGTIPDGSRHLLEPCAVGQDLAEQQLRRRGLRLGLKARHRREPGRLVEGHALRHAQSGPVRSQGGWRESAQEITYRPVVNGKESDEERVFALRTDPLRLEMFCRNSRDEMRLDWQAPRSVCIPVFDATVAAASGGAVVGMGWTSPEVTTSTLDGLWAALVFKARNPQKFKMDVSDVVAVDRPGYLARSMTINPTGKRTQEHIYANERTGEMIYRIVDPETKRETDGERVIAVKEGPLRMEFFHRHVSDGYRSYWQAPMDSVKQMVQELVDYAAKTEGKGGVVGLGIRSEEIKGVSHDSLWRSIMESVREPARFFACSNVSIKECQGFAQRMLT